MNTCERIRGALRTAQLRRMIREADHSPQRVGGIVDTLIARARRDEAAGSGRDRILFDFEAAFEEISDLIAALADDEGGTEAYRNIYAKLYEFAQETMADSYMPLYLYILYRYANALLRAGETGRSVELFEQLREGTQRLIGIRNSYGIHCLERLAVAADADGQKSKADRALAEMKTISEEEFGEDSAMALAVRTFGRRMQSHR